MLPPDIRQTLLVLCDRLLAPIGSTVSGPFSPGRLTVIVLLLFWGTIDVSDCAGAESVGLRAAYSLAGTTVDRRPTGGPETVTAVLIVLYLQDSAHMSRTCVQCDNNVGVHWAKRAHARRYPTLSLSLSLRVCSGKLPP